MDMIPLFRIFLELPFAKVCTPSHLCVPDFVSLFSTRWNDTIQMHAIQIFFWLEENNQQMNMKKKTSEMTLHLMFQWFTWRTSVHLFSFWKPFLSRIFLYILFSLDKSNLIKIRILSNWLSWFTFLFDWKTQFSTFF